MNREEIESLVQDYYHYKQKQKEYEDKVAAAKDKLLNLFEEFDTDVLKTADYVIQKKIFGCERINRQDCPVDVWREYATRYESDVLYIKKVNEEKKEKRSRYRKERRSRKSRLR